MNIQLTMQPVLRHAFDYLKLELLFLTTRMQFVDFKHQFAQAYLWHDDNYFIISDMYWSIHAKYVYF